MSFDPVLPVSGYAGWTFLKRTMASQTAAFVKSPEIVRDEDYFRANIGKVSTAADLVKDPRLLKIALGAFGLDADIANKAFIQKVLSDGTTSTTALANKLADKQYAQFSAAFAFGDQTTPNTKKAGFSDQIIAAYNTKQFQVAVGNQDDDLRLALNAQTELTALAKSSSSEAVKWYGILGSAPLAQVFTKALGLPANISAVDLDKQLKVFQDKTASTFGDKTISQFTDPTKVESLIRRFLVRSQADSYASQSGSNAALAMMQQTATFMQQNRSGRR